MILQFLLICSLGPRGWGGLDALVDTPAKNVFFGGDGSPKRVCVCVFVGLIKLIDHVSPVSPLLPLNLVSEIETRGWEGVKNTRLYNLLNCISDPLPLTPCRVQKRKSQKSYASHSNSGQGANAMTSFFYTLP